VDHPASEAQRLAVRRHVAARQIPEILFWAGVLTLVFGVVNLVVVAHDPVFNWIINVVFGPVFIAMAWAMRRGTITERWIPWGWAACATVLVFMLVNAFRLDPIASNLAYIAVVIAAFGPVTHSWPPFLMASALMLVAAATVFVAAAWPGGYADLIVCVAAALVSGLLLRLRLRAIDELADSQAQLERKATIDELTDTLNRAGLVRSAPALVAGAERAGEGLVVWFADVRGLKAANDTYGHPFGDRVIQAVASALKSCVRTNDLLVRWGGDEFVVLGVGREGSAEDLATRVNAALEKDPTVDHDWRTTVTVGFASGGADSDIQGLISGADADMYRRRAVA
jgi:diguanylate cyclase (GGDEF)-like protein